MKKISDNSTRFSRAQLESPIKLTIQPSQLDPIRPVDLIELASCPQKINGVLIITRTILVYNFVYNHVYMILLSSPKSLPFFNFDAKPVHHNSILMQKHVMSFITALNYQQSINLIFSMHSVTGRLVDSSIQAERATLVSTPSQQVSLERVPARANPLVSYAASISTHVGNYVASSKHKASISDKGVTT